MAGDALVRVVYVSTATRPFHDDDARAVLEGARAFNAEHAVTGLLVHAGGRFLQHLEGPLEGVAAALVRTVASRRHADLRSTDPEPVRVRAFGSWSMGFEHAERDAVVEHLLEPLVAAGLMAQDEVCEVLLARFSALNDDRRIVVRPAEDPS